MAIISNLPETNLRRASALLCFFMCLLPLCAVARMTGPDTLQSDSIFLFKEKILFRHASSVLDRDFAGNSDRLVSIRTFLTDTCGKNILNVSVIGSYSPEGTATFNAALAGARARALSDWLKDFNLPCRPAISVVHPDPSAKDAARQRFAELQVAWRTCPAVAALRPDARQEEAVTAPHKRSEGSDERRSADVAESAPLDSGKDTSGSLAGQSFAGRLFLFTNILYDAAFTPNIGVGFEINDRFALLADWMYARWNNSRHHRYWRIYGGDIEVRCRIGNRRSGSPLGGHHIGAYCSLACYDFQAGWTHRGVMSDKYNYAAGLSYTYSLPVSTRFNIDFSLGLGYLWGTYKRHIPIDGCDVWLSTHKLKYFGPTKVGVSLVWLIGGAVKNDRKGGRR